MSLLFWLHICGYLGSTIYQIGQIRAIYIKLEPFTFELGVFDPIIYYAIKTVSILLIRIFFLLKYWAFYNTTFIFIKTSFLPV